MKLLCGEISHTPVQPEIDYPSFHMLFFSRLFKTSRGTSCPSIRPTPLSAVCLTCAPSSQSEFVTSVINDPRCVNGGPVGQTPSFCAFQDSRPNSEFLLWNRLLPVIPFLPTYQSISWKKFQASPLFLSDAFLGLPMTTVPMYRLAVCADATQTFSPKATPHPMGWWPFLASGLLPRSGAPVPDRLYKSQTIPHHWSPWIAPLGRTIMTDQSPVSNTTRIACNPQILDR